MNITLPNGVVIEDVPQGTSKEEIKRKAIEAGLATEQDFVEQSTPVTATTPTEPSTLDTLKSSAVEMLPELGATGMGILGLAAGGPLLAPVTAGLGAMTGEVLQNLIQGDETKVDDLVQEGLLQASFEVGGGLIGRVGERAFQVAPDVLRALNITTQDANLAIQQVLKKRPDAVQSGTPESIEQTQQLLREGRIDPVTGERVRGTLSKSQTGRQGFFSKIGEQFARVGLSGQPTFDALTERNDQIILNAFNDLVQGFSGRVRDPSEIGETFTQTLNLGRSALSSQYSQRLTPIIGKFKGKFVNTRSLKDTVDQRIKDGTVDFDSIDPDVRKVYDAIQQLPDNMNADRALDFLKLQSSALSKMLDPRGQGYNTTGAAQLTQFIDEVLKPSIKTQLAKADPKAFKEYEELNAFYSEGKKGLTPKLLDAVVKKGEAGDFVAVGQTLFGTTKSDTVDAAFKALAKAKQINPDLNVQEAAESLRQGYLIQFFGSEGRTIDQLRSAAKAIEQKTNKGVLFNTVLGASAPGFKKLLNAAVDSGERPSEGVLSLSIRGREIGTLDALASAGLFGSYSADFLPGIIGSVALLGSPAILAKISTNAKAVDRLTALDKASSKMTPQALSTALIRFGNEFGIPIEETGQNMLDSMVSTDLEEQRIIEQLPQ